MRRGIIIGILLVVAACTGPAQQTLSERDFRDHVIKLLLAADPGAKADTTSDLQFKFTRANGSVTTVELRTGYDEYVQDLSQLDAIVGKWKALVLARAVDNGDLSERLIYLVRHKDYVGPPPNLKPGETYSTALWRPLAGDVVAVLMANDATSLRGIGQEHLDKAHIKEADAWQFADANLKSLIGPIGIGDLNGDGPTAYSADSGLATGLIAHPDSCAGPNGIWNDGRVVLVLDRNIFISTLPNDPVSVERFWAFAKPGLAAHQFMSETPLTCRNHKWEAAEIPR